MSEFKVKYKDYILLHIVLLLYSVCGIFSKLASDEKFLSLEFLFFYSIVIVILFVYAILWQQILKKMSLTTAYLNKSIVVIWGIVWGGIFFKEKITINMIIGAIIIMFGILIVVSDDGK